MESVEKVDIEADNTDIQTDNESNGNINIKKIFINYVNSFQGLAIVKKIIKINENTLAEIKEAEKHTADLLKSKEKTEEDKLKVGTTDEEAEEEIENEDDEAGNTNPDEAALPKYDLYEIYGTLQDRSDGDKEDISILIHSVLDPRNPTFLKTILDCKFIIFDIGIELSQVKLAQKVLDSLEADCKKKKIKINLDTDDEKQPKRIFILISTIMTWMMTKRSEAAEEDDEDEQPLNEESYRKRRPHPCYIKHLGLEKEVMNAQKRHARFLRTLVICPGITYGGEQDVFHYLYKMAYCGQLDIPIFQPGKNILPVIYIQDFANIVFDLINKLPSRKIRYLLVIQPESVKLMQMAETAVKYVGGEEIRIKVVPKEQMFLIDPTLMTQRVYNLCTLNLQLSTVYFESYDFIMGEDIDSFGEKLAIEYHEERKLKPVKIIINGPPCSGKSTLALALNNYYRVHLIKLDTIIQDEIKLMEHKIKSAQLYLDEINLAKDDQIGEDNIEENDEENDNTATIEKVNDLINEWKEELYEIMNYFENLDENGVVEFSYIKKYLLKRMESKPCSENQGYIIDGFPFLYKEIVEIFTNDAEGAETEDEEGGDTEINVNSKIKPDLVVLLDGKDEIFCDRAMALLEDEAVDTKNTEDKMLARLEKYRESTYEDVSVSNFFYDQNILPLEIKLNKNTTNEEIVKCVIDIIGSPRVYAASKAELAAIARLNSEIADKERLKELNLKCKRELVETEKREKKLQEWTDKFIELKYQEQEQLEARSLPLRHYLMKYILPVLTEGLLEVAKIQPDDPVDYLAEFLFKQNPEGKMLNPGFSEMTKKLLLTREFDLSEEDEIINDLESESNNCSIDPAQQIDKPKTTEELTVEKEQY